MMGQMLICVGCLMADTEEIELGTKGGAGSKIPWWELLDFRALEEVARVLEHGARKYARDNWRAVPVEEHIRHAVRHLFKSQESKQQYLAYYSEGDTIDDLAHGACRAVMALAVALQTPETAERAPKGLACKPEEERPF